MPYSRQHRQSYSQNFIKNPALIRYILQFLDMPKSATVLDIGAGQGIISQELFQQGYQVIAYELDPELYQDLQNNFGDKIAVICQDIKTIQYPITPFYIVSNPPFSIFSQFIKSLYSHQASPQGALIMGQKQAIERVTGLSEASVISIILQTLYLCEIVHTFHQKDFSPAPSVVVQLLKLQKIPTPIWETKQDYITFISYAFSQQKRDLFHNLDSVFTYEQWKRLSKTYQFQLKVQPKDLTISQWKGIYHYYQQSLNLSKKIT